MEIGKHRTSSWAVLALVVALSLAAGVRLRLLNTPLERDEGEFAYAGQLLLDGIPPYQLEYNIKLPGTYAAYGLIMGIFGQTTSAIHLGFLIVNAASTILMFLIVRRLFDARRAGMAAAIFALLSLSPAVLGLQGHATHLVVLTALGGWLLLLKARENGKFSWHFWSGFAFGLSFVCKQPGIFFALFGTAILYRDFLLTQRAERRRKSPPLLIFGAGAAGPFLLTCLWMWLAGTFEKFWFWTIVFPPQHGSEYTEDQFWWQLNEMSRRGFAMEVWAWVAVIGLVCLLFKQKLEHNSPSPDASTGNGRDAAANFMVLALAGFSFCALLVSFTLFPHYFIVLLPVVSILIAEAFATVATWIRWSGAAILFTAAFAAFIYVNRAAWFEMTPVEFCRSLYQREAFPEAIEVARYIREHSKSNDTIAVLGSEPEIFFYAHRHSASGYVYMYDLNASGPYAPIMQAEMRDEISRARPLYIVKVGIPTSWRTTRNSHPEFSRWSEAYTRHYYRLTGRVTLIGASETHYFWDDAVNKANAGSWYNLEIYRRKAKD